MNILGIDTSTKKANVCIKNNDKIISKCIDNEITHSEKLLPLIDITLKDVNITLNDINYLACSIGPGSFTGIRIGIATIKAFSKVLNVPIFAISSLDVIAYTDTKDDAKYVISIMDAKNNRIYYSVYEVKYINYNSRPIKIIETILEPSNNVIDTAIENISSLFIKEDYLSSKTLKIIGDCVECYKEKFTNIFDSLFKHTYVYEQNISGDVLINMAENYIKTGYNYKYEKDYLTLDALYVRPSQAERAKRDEL